MPSGLSPAGPPSSSGRLPSIGSPKSSSIVAEDRLDVIGQGGHEPRLLSVGPDRTPTSAFDGRRRHGARRAGPTNPAGDEPGQAEHEQDGERDGQADDDQPDPGRSQGLADAQSGPSCLVELGAGVPAAGGLDHSLGRRQGKLDAEGGQRSLVLEVVLLGASAPRSGPGHRSVAIRPPGRRRSWWPGAMIVWRARSVVCRLSILAPRSRTWPVTSTAFDLAESTFEARFSIASRASCQRATGTR